MRSWRGEQTEATYRGTWTTTVHIPVSLDGAGVAFQRGIFHGSSIPGSWCLKERQTRSVLKTCDFPAAQLWGVREESTCLTHAVKGKSGSSITNYLTVTQSKVLDYFRELREPNSRLKGYFSCEE